MVKQKSYKLLCPIARALDRIGDRWTLLILRDLHAGPMRFAEIQKALPGLAANLLTDRLNKMVADGLVSKGEDYRLTEHGQATLDVLFELAKFGGTFEPMTPVQKPGSLRTVATTLLATARRIELSGLTLRAGLIVSETHMQINVADGKADVLYGVLETPDIVVSAGYEDLLSLSEGDLDLERFAQSHAKIRVLTEGAESSFVTFMTRILGEIGSA